MVSSQVNYLPVNIRMDGRCVRKERPNLKNRRLGEPLLRNVWVEVGSKPAPLKTKGAAPGSVGEKWRYATRGLQNSNYSVELVSCFWRHFSGVSRALRKDV